jgi:hypothetical protein
MTKLQYKRDIRPLKFPVQGKQERLERAVYQSDSTEDP